MEANINDQKSFEVSSLLLPEPTHKFDGQGFFDVKAVARILDKSSPYIVRWTIGGRISYDKTASQRYKRFLYTAEAVTQAANNYREDWDAPEFTGTLTTEKISLEKYTRLNLVNAWTLSNLDCIADVVTKYTNKARKIGKKPTRFICPFCGSWNMETYEDSDGGTHWRCDCLNGKTKLNDEIIAALLGFDVAKNRDEIFAYAKQFLPDLGEEHEHFSPPADLKIGIFADSDEPADKTQPANEYEEQIRTDLEFKQDFQQLSDKDKRGLNPETVQHFDIGTDLEWQHPKMKGTTATPRILFPLGDVKDPPAYNAILTNTGREKFKWAMDLDYKWANKSLTAGAKLVFNPVALTSEICFLTEGEFDAVSIWQALNHQRFNGKTVDVVAFGGTSGAINDFIKRLSRMKNPPMFVAVFDKDANQAGQEAAETLIKLLHPRFVPVVSNFLNDFMSDDDKKLFVKKDEHGNIVYDDEGKPIIKVDANAILTELGDDKLNEILNKILVDSVPELERLAEKFKVDRENAPATTDDADPLPYIPAESSHRKKSDLQNSYREIDELVDRINNSATKEQLLSFLDKDRKGTGHACPSCGSGSHSKGTGAIGFTTKGGPHVACGRCHWGANFLLLFAMKNHLSLRGKDYFKTVRAAADASHTPYDPKIFERKKFTKKNQHTTGDETIDRWQKINGVINPDWLAELKDAAAQINGFEVVTAANANDISIQRYLGMCRYYSFFASVDEKFFARLRDAKADAKKKIAAWKKDTNQPEPTDADKALAALDIININRKVEACVTQAKRAHQKYIDSTRRKEVDDQREAEHAAYVREQPTTKKEIEDCPVDLILPEGVIFNDEGIKIEDTDKPLDINDKRPIFTACQNLVVPTKIFREPSKHVTQYEIAIKTGRIWRRKVFDGRTLQDARSVSELGNFGAHIAEPRMMAKYFAKIIALNEDNGRLEEICSYAQPGWHDADFSEFVYPTGGDNYVVLRAGFDFKQEFATLGDAEKWKQTFIDAMNRGGAVARIFTGTALAAPLVRPLHTSNMQIHLHGDINNGKTALASLVASIFGNPKMIFRTFDSSIKNRLAVAAAYNDLPTFLEEMETRQTKEMEKALPQSVYTYFTGKANQANKRDGTAREPFYFSGARLSTGERPMLSDNDQTGAFKRIVQIRCKKLFDPKFAAPLYPFTENNFGHFGREWTSYISKHADIIRKQFTSYVPIFTSQKIYEGTQVNSVVAAATAYQYFLICIGAQSDFDEDNFTKDIAAILELLPTNEEISGSERLLRALRSFVDGHPKNFVTQTKSTAPDEHLEDVEAASFSETYGKIFNNGEVAIYPTALKKIIEKELGFASSETHITKWNEEGKLITSKGRSNHLIRINGAPKRVIHFKTGILSGEIDEKK